MDSDRTFKCNGCGEWFYSAKKVKEHVRFVHMYRPSQRTEGNKMANNGHNVRMSAGGAPSSSSSTPDKSSGLKCGHCPKTFKNVQGLRVHEKFVHNNVKDFRCPNCGMEFFHRWQLRNHDKQCSRRNNRGGQQREQEEEGSKYNCSKCDISFTSIVNLNIHARLIHNMAVSLTPQPKKAEKAAKRPFRSTGGNLQEVNPEEVEVPATFDEPGSDPLNQAEADLFITGEADEYPIDGDIPIEVQIEEDEDFGTGEATESSFDDGPMGGGGGFESRPYGGGGAARGGNFSNPRVSSGHNSDSFAQSPFFKCEICDREFSKMVGLKVHKFRNHGIKST